MGTFQPLQAVREALTALTPPTILDLALILFNHLLPCSGYPEPEVTWYKDDIELDRYCGLPKYEITHQGNRHTLQLYR